MSAITIEVSHVESPVGRICFAVSAAGLHAMDFAEDDGAIRSRLAKWFPQGHITAGDGARELAGRLRAYFEGDIHVLDTIAVSSVGSVFQKQVWDALRTIRAGQMASYGTIARSISNPAAVRAVGAANKRNPIALVVPCHRVIASDGTLCGYAGGLWRKQWLLRHEKALLV